MIRLETCIVAKISDVGLPLDQYAVFLQDFRNNTVVFSIE